MADNKGVMILGEVIQGNLSSISTELLGCGRKLADELGQGLSALLIGSAVSGWAREAITYGADKVYVVEDPLLGDYQADSYVLVSEKAAKEVNPSILLMGQTEVGSDIAARLAFRLETAAVLDCVALEIDPDSKRLLQTKPVYGGKAQAIYVTDTEIGRASCRERV